MDTITMLYDVNNSKLLKIPTKIILVLGYIRDENKILYPHITLYGDDDTAWGMNYHYKDESTAYNDYRRLITMME